MKGVTMINDFIQLFENAGVPLPNENSLGEKIIPDDDPVKLQNFWNWFGDSKCVDKKGRPLVVYHGTNNKFNTFDKLKIGSNAGFAGGGFYFSEIQESPSQYDEGTARSYGNNIIVAYLNVKNPLTFDEKTISKDTYLKILNIHHFYGGKWESIYDEANSDGILFKSITSRDASYFKITPQEWIEIFEELGFDGLKDDENHWWQVFESNQIKSINNAGTFSSTSNNIYETVAYHGTSHSFNEFSLTESYSKYKKQQEEVLTETLRNEGGFFITSSGNDIINLMKNKPKEYRIVYDSNLDLYMICGANDAIHQEMLEKAYNNGLYYNMEEFIDSLGIFQNYIEVGQDGGWDDDGNEIESYLYYMIFDPSNTWAVGDDDYNEVYNLSFGNLFTRGCDITETPFYNLISKYMV